MLDLHPLPFTRNYAHPLKGEGTFIVYSIQLKI